MVKSRPAKAVDGDSSKGALRWGKRTVNQVYFKGEDILSFTFHLYTRSVRLLYLDVARIHTGVKVEWEYQKYLEDLGEPKVEPQVWSMMDASTYWHKGELINVGNVGSNAELCRGNAAHSTTKPETRVGWDLLAHPLTVGLMLAEAPSYSFWTSC